MLKTPIADPGTPVAPVYELKVELQEIRPAIWRRIRLSGATTLKQLHLVLQAVMGWQDYHLYLFTVGEDTYGEPDPEVPCHRASAFTLSAVLPVRGATAVYEYDFGDSWRHTLTVMAIGEAAPASPPECLAGRRACPPEDSGGPSGYADLLKALRNPRHPEHADMRRWAGEAFDPESLDLEAINRRLLRLRRLLPRNGRRAGAKPQPPANGPASEPPPTMPAPAPPTAAAPARRTRRAAPPPAVGGSNPPGAEILPALVAPEDWQLLSQILDAEISREGTEPGMIETTLMQVLREVLTVGIRVVAEKRGIGTQAETAAAQESPRSRNNA